MELAIDTATERASLALARHGVTLATLSWPSSQNQSRELLPALLRLLELAGASLPGLSALVVVVGPGSYNALRVGLSTAKGLAFGLGLPLVGVSTLEAEAYPYALTRLPICPMLRFGRGQVAWACYQLKGQRWLKLHEEQVATVEEMCARVDRRSLFCGPAAGEAAPELRHWLGGGIRVRPGAACRAAVAAELGWQRLERGELDDPARLQPLYLRPPAITTPRPRPGAPLATLEA